MQFPRNHFDKGEKDVIEQFLEETFVPLMVRYVLKNLGEQCPSLVDRAQTPAPPVERQALPAAPALESKKLLLSKKEAAAALSISVRTIDNLISTKQLGHARIAKRVLIPVRELERFVKRSTVIRS